MNSNKDLVLGSSTNVASNGTNVIRFYTNGYDLTSAPERMRIDASGNVGIGTTGPVAKLHVVSAWDQARFESTDEAQVYSGSVINMIAGSSPKRFDVQVGAASNTRVGAGNFGIYDFTNSAARFVINQSGNVGIGTTGPLAKMHIVTTSDTTPNTISVWDARYLLIGAAANAGGVGISYNQTGNYGVINAASPGTAWRNLVLQSGGGNVGIGTTTPQFTLDVTRGVGSNSNAVASFGYNGDYSDVEHSYGPAYAAAVTAFGTGADTVGALHIGMNNVTSDPKEYGIITQAMAGSWNNHAAVTSGTYLPGLGFAGQTDGNAGTGMTLGAAIEGLVDNTVSSGVLPTSLVFRTSATSQSGMADRMTITSAGNVGINTTAPNATLDVNGYGKLAKNASAPVTCDATHEGSIAYTGTTTHYLCYCNGTSWKQAHSPSTAVIP